MLNHEDILRMFKYDPDTGHLEYIERRQGRRFGPLGAKDKDGYMLTGINYKKYPLHRVIWLYVYGEWPTKFIDHINGDKTDNRISNLREATNAENMRNVGKQAHNTSGLKSVSFHNLRKKWRATISVNKKSIHLGLFNCPAAASFAYQIAADKYHGSFARPF
jgi:hypothetical protein